MISPIRLEPQWLMFDLPALIVMSGLLFIFIMTKRQISKLEGSILLGCYFAILLVQIYLSLK